MSTHTDTHQALLRIAREHNLHFNARTQSIEGRNGTLTLQKNGRFVIHITANNAGYISTGNTQTALSLIQGAS